ncbi:MAG: hypothetical protein J3K34DRAFT_512165 [Monoraphidium minutum]|nr:MAG: hypothetical protein J3K34DRAFT_512165 [Monoraphidium minutum]
MSHLAGLQAVLQAAYPHAALAPAPLADALQQEHAHAKGDGGAPGDDGGAASDQLAPGMQEEQERPHAQRQTSHAPQREAGGQGSSAVGAAGATAEGGAQTAAAAAPVGACGAAAASASGAPADAYDERIAFITQRFDAAAGEAEALQAYLRQAAEEAVADEERVLVEADKEFTPAWRASGLPSRPPRLALDPGRAAAGALLDPAAVAGRVAAAAQREVLSPPRVMEYADGAAEPHHLRATGNARVRQGITAAKRSQGLLPPPRPGAWSTLAEGELRPKLEAAEARQRALALQMSPAQWEAEERVIRAMRQRLSFLRNPRYRDAPASPPRRAAAGTFGPAGGAGSLARPQPGQMQQQEQQPWHVEPGEVVFGGYVAGGEYSRTLRLRNVGGVARVLRLLPPASQYFHVSLPRFPLAGASEVVPGMAAEMTVKFTPDSLADYDDVVVVASQLGRLEVPLRGRRPPPALGLPDVIDVGDALLGNTRRVQVHFTNTGGDGRFRLVPESLWPPPAAAAATPGAVTDAGNDCSNDEARARAALAPFWLEPRLLDLPAGAAGSLSVEFAPRGLGGAEARFVLVCDNCRVRGFAVCGRGTDVDVRLEEPDGRPCPAAAAPAAGDTGGSSAGAPLIWMGEVVPGGAAARELCVRNATPLALPFRWEVEGLATAGAGGAPGGAPPFAVHPARGVLQPGEQLTVSLSFAPGAVGPASARARLVVDRAASAAHPGVIGPAHEEEAAAAAAAVAAVLAAGGGGSAAGGDASGAGGGARFEVLSVVLQGAGAPAALLIDRPSLRFAGALAAGQRAEAALLLRNPTAAPVHFQFDAAVADDEWERGGGGGGLGVGTLALAPNGGVMPPHGSVAVAVVVRATHAGPLRRALRCAVRHGRPLALVVEATIVEPEVLPVVVGSSGGGASSGSGGRLDFGLVRIGHGATRELVLRNASAHSQAAWSLEQIDVPGDEAGPEGAAVAGSAPVAAGGGAPQRPHGRQALQIEPAAGVLPPSGECAVRVACAAAAPGAHRLALRCSSGGGAHVSIVEAAVTVVVPNVELEPCRWAGLGWGGVVWGRFATARCRTGTPALCLINKAPPWQSTHAPALTTRCSLDLGACFKGVPLRRSLRLRNTAALPCGFSFALWRRAPGGRLLPAFAPRSAAARGAAAALGCAAAGGAEGEGAIGVEVSPRAGVLQPGQSVKIRVSVDPLAEGAARVFGVCSVEGMAAPRGFSIGCAVKGLRIGLRAFGLPAWLAAGRPGLAGRGGSAQQDCTPPPGAAAAGGGGGEEEPLALDFGVCELGRPESRVLVLTKWTSMAADAAAWVERHPAAGGGGQLRWTAHAQPATVGSGGGCGTVGGVGAAGTVRSASPPCGARSAGGGGEVAGDGGGVRGASGATWARAAPGSTGSAAGWHARSAGATSSVCSSGRSASAAARSHGAARRAASPDGPSGGAPLGARLTAGGGTLAPFAGRGSAGNTMMAARRELAEASAALGPRRGGAGLTLALAPGGGRLAPGGALAIEVVAFSAMPGTYGDMLVVQVGELPPRRIPVVVRVAGSPLALQKDRVAPLGLPPPPQQQQPGPAEAGGAAGGHAEPGGAASTGAGAGAAPPSVPYGSQRAWGGARGGLEVGLELGEVPVGAEQRRTFYVANRGCMPMALEWDAAEEFRSAAAGGGGGGAAAQGAAEAAGGGGDGGGVEAAEAAGAGGAQEEGAGAEAGAEEEALAAPRVTAFLWETRDARRPLRLQLLGGFTPAAAPPPAPLPQLLLTAGAAAAGCRLELSGGCGGGEGGSAAAGGVEWCCPSTLFGQAAAHPAFRRVATLSNPAGCELAFALAVEGPFDLLSAAPSMTQDPRRHAAALKGAASLRGGGGGGGRDGCGSPSSSGGAGGSGDGIICLPPRESVDGGGGDSTAEGALVVLHANGERQRVPLTARVPRPLVACGAALLDFGAVHPRAPRRLELVLTNPTAVDAAWALVDAAAPASAAAAAAATAAAAAAAGGDAAGSGGATAHLAPRGAALNGALLSGMLVAAPGGGGGGAGAANSAAAAAGVMGPFTVSPASGVIPGRGLGLPHSQRVAVVFAPSAAAPAAVAARVVVHGGRGCEVTVYKEGKRNAAGFPGTGPMDMRLVKVEGTDYSELWGSAALHAEFGRALARGV